MIANKLTACVAISFACLGLCSCSPQNSDSAKSRSTQLNTPTMNSIIDVATRSGMTLPTDAKILSQEDNLGTVQKAQGWVIQVSLVPNPPESAIKKADNEANEVLKVMVSATPNFDFGRLLETTNESARWGVDKDSWTMSSVKTSKGTFILLDWIKQK